MLRLQLKNLAAPKLPKKVTFLIQLSGICFLVHTVVLALFFFLQDSKNTFCIDMRTNNASVVFVPLLKTPQLIQAKTTTQVPCKEPVNKPKLAVPEKKTIPAKKSTTQTVVSPKKEAVKQQVQKKVAKPPVKKPVQQKTVPKKATPLLENKKEIKPAPQKPAEAKQVELSKPHEKVTQNTLLVGNEERDLFIAQEQLKKNILEHWKRPTNIPDTALCHIKVIVHKDGTKEIVVEKSSQAIALDMSARNFLLNYDFPEQWYGKELSIIF